VHFASVGAENHNNVGRYGPQTHIISSTYQKFIVAGQLNANMQHNRANGDTSTKIGVMTP